MKRLLDVAISLPLLAVSMPLMAVIWLVIRTTSGGPAIFRQTRTGLVGKPFVLYKFRSMYTGSEARLAGLRDSNEMEGPVFKMARDPRVTPAGRVLRRLSLDELPQLWNVLRGDMSLVGPRPLIPSTLARYERWQARRTEVKPGITGLWQIEGRNLLHFEHWMHLDEHYVDHWSLALDLSILARTIPAVLSSRGAW